MARLADSSAHDRKHRQVWELLPWYVNRTLDTHERELVEEHLRTCLTCRGEVNVLRQLERQVRDADPLQEVLEESLARTKARLTARLAQQPLEQKNSNPPENKSRHWLAALRTSFGSSPGMMKGIVAAQTLLLVIICVFGTLPQGVDNSPNFQVLSTERGAKPVQETRWQIVFADHIPERRLRTLLHTASARIVDGPSTSGVYTIVLDKQSANGVNTEKGLAALRHAPDVHFFELLPVGYEPR